MPTQTPPRRPLPLSLSLSLSLVACGGTDFVKREYEAGPIDHSGDWMDDAGPRPESSERVVIDGAARRGDPFRNTYYDFPAEGAGAKNAKVFDPSCQPIASVTKEFHDKVCMQGSGRLSTGETVSFAKRVSAFSASCASANFGASTRISAGARGREDRSGRLGFGGALGCAGRAGTRVIGRLGGIFGIGEA